MSTFPHASIPHRFREDHEVDDFMDDVRRLLSQLQILDDGVVWRAGTGSPEGTIVANPGSLYTDIAGGAGVTLYVKESGTGDTGWVAK